MYVDNLQKMFLDEHKGKRIKMIFESGYQLQGVLKDFDDASLLIDTDAYSANGPVLVSCAHVSTIFCPQD